MHDFPKIVALAVAAWSFAFATLTLILAVRDTNSTWLALVWFLLAMLNYSAGLVCWYEATKPPAFRDEEGDWLKRLEEKFEQESRFIEEFGKEVPRCPQPPLP